MTSILKNEKYKTRIKWTIDTLSLCAVLQYCVYRFFQSTMFNFYYSNTYKLITMGLLLVFGGIRYLYVVKNRLKGYEEKENRVKYLLRCGGAWLLALPFFYVGWKHDYKFLFFLPICCMCLYDMDVGKVCRWFFMTIGVCLVALILCALSGTVRNLVKSPWDRFVGSFGTVNTTDFASYVSMLLLTLWCGMKFRKLYTCMMYIAMVAMCSFATWYYTDSRTVLIVGGLSIIVAIWDIIENNGLKNYKRVQRMGKRLKRSSALAFPIVGLIVLSIAVFYAIKAPFALQLDSILSGRIETALLSFQKYGVRIFGNKIIQMHGNGATSVSSGAWSSGYGYLDSAYAMMAIRYGWLLTGIIGGLWIWMTIRAIKDNKTRIALTLAILAVHGFSEARILDINYNIFLVMPFCSYKLENDVEFSSREERPFVVIGIIIFGASCFLLPNILSFLRSFFYINDWNKGAAAIYSFITCSLLVSLLLFLWKTTSMWWVKKSKISLPFLCVLLTFVVCTAMINSSINLGVREQADRIESEKQIVDKVVSVATLPVYAAEMDELYRKKNMGFSSHIFSTDELGREKGTMFVDKDIEAFSIVQTGGKYAQISEWSGIYTYDDAVVDALNEYEWNDFYTGKRSMNLNDVAVFNELKPTGVIALSKGMSIETLNNAIDQFTGMYQVVFSFSGLKQESEGDVIAIEVLGEAGDDLICREAITAESFDETGSCEYVLTYQLRDTPKVTYAIHVLKDVVITINDITWWRQS